MTTHEVADLLQVSLRTVRRLIADGRLPVVRIGHSVRVSMEAFEGLLTEQAGRTCIAEAIIATLHQSNEAITFKGEVSGEFSSWQKLDPVIHQFL